MQATWLYRRHNCRATADYQQLRCTGFWVTIALNTHKFRCRPARPGCTPLFSRSAFGGDAVSESTQLPVMHSVIQTSVHVSYKTRVYSHSALSGRGNRILLCTEGLVAPLCQQYRQHCVCCGAMHRVSRPTWYLTPRD